MNSSLSIIFNIKNNLTTIFNQGVPSLTFSGSESEFLHTIADEAIDEAFPPNAAEAAELEAAETFVSLMAQLALLEEKNVISD